ncbi:hypothetical protein OG474_25625 [Kribbella sp. NBC_01505]|uniref:hypothetical protein n=1 Tax=Kribbella sp. NBC_01505 TaxID=2903580 RepID=UPI00386BDC9A
MTVRRTARLLLISGALAGVIGLIGAIVTDSTTKLSYQVMVLEPSTSGRLPACKPTVIVVDRTTGNELPCSGTPEGGFTASERQEVLKLSTSMAADGFDAVDEFKLSELATTIGLRHDDPTSSATWAFATLGILGAAALVSGITLRIVETVRGRTPRR